MDYIDKIPSRIKYYLLDWKDENMEAYLKSYGELRLRDLTRDQLVGLFIKASDRDRDKLT